MNKNSITVLTLLLLIFAFSVWIRVPNMDKPLGRHHEFITAHTLNTLKIWDKSSPSNYHFSPVFIFDNPGDKGMGAPIGVDDTKGDSYYTSYPPFGFLFPYYFFKLSGLEFKVLPLQIFNLVLHFIAAFFLFLTINLLYNKKLKDGLFLPSLLAFVLYLFSAANLWFHSNVYFVDILAQIFFIIEIYVFLLILKKENTGSGKALYFLLGCINFLTIYTEWIGLFVAFILFVICISKIKKNKSYFHLALIVAITSILSLSITVYQYASINGFDSLVNASIHKYKIRSGLTNQISEYAFSLANPDSYTFLKNQYLKGYRDIIPLVGLFSIIVTIIFLIRRKSFFNKDEGLLLLFIAIPILLHHLIFYNFTVMHDFSTLKTSVLFIVFLAIAFYKLIEFTDLKVPKLKWILISPVILLLLLNTYKCIQQYKEVNDPNLINYYYQAVGIAIHDHALPNEIVYATEQLYPETEYYSERNAGVVKNVKEGIEDIKKRNSTKGILFYLTPNVTTVNRIVRFNANGDSLVVK